MATHDLTKNAVTIAGNHSFLAYALNKARKDHEVLYEEIKKFKPQVEWCGHKYRSHVLYAD